jgi:very-short-patch-repair endonuclease
MRPDRFFTPTEFARMLRKNLTPEERIMWHLLRNRKFRGYKFLRQHPIKVWETNGRHHFYYADFYCSEKKLVVEIDGLIHAMQEDYDRARDIIMLELKLNVLRVGNEEVNGDVVGVLQKIALFLTHPPAPSLLRKEGGLDGAER